MLWPFEKPIWQLKEADLSELAGKQEAFTFDYKSADFIGHPKDIAKHVASFANHHGGWLFIGIAADKATNEPHLPPEGVSPAEAISETVYSAVMANLSPAPMVTVQLVTLQNDNVVIAVHIDESQDTPHIHRPTGRIFVRSGNVTDWVDHVRERHDLERLHQRGERTREAALELVGQRRFGETLWEQLYQEVGDEHLYGGFAAVFPLTVGADLLSRLHGDLKAWGSNAFFRKMQWPSQKLQREDWQHGVTFLQPTGECGQAGLTITRHGHIEAAWLRDSMRGAWFFVEQGFDEVLQFAQKRLEEAGYLGRIGIAIAVADAGGACARTIQISSVREWPRIDFAEVADELHRGEKHRSDWGNTPPGFF